MIEISEKEVLQHIDDEDFFVQYGNPVLVRPSDKRGSYVIMSIQYYERLTRPLQQKEEGIDSGT